VKRHLNLYIDITLIGFSGVRVRVTIRYLFVCMQTVYC